MKIIDSQTGQEVKIGQTISRWSDRYETLDAIKEGLFTAKAKLTIMDERGVWSYWQPLIVRRFHPAFMFQKVAFIPS